MGCRSDDSDDEISEYDPNEDENNDEDQEYSQDDDFSDLRIANDDTTDPEYCMFLTPIAEKVMELSIAFITEYFPGAITLIGLLLHFADVVGISNKCGRFQEPYNCTSYVAALSWMCHSS